MRLVGSVPNGELPEVYASADILVHVESFDPEWASYTHLSLSTKVTEYMMAGRPLLGVGPRSANSIRYISESGAGVSQMEDDATELLGKVRSLVADRSLRERLGLRARAVALESGTSRLRRGSGFDRRCAQPFRPDTGAAPFDTSQRASESSCRILHPNLNTRTSPGTNLPRTVLILGGAGMLGHKLLQVFRTRSASVACTIRGAVRGSCLERVDLFRESDVVENVDATRFEQVERVLDERKPDVVINCVGVIKQRPQAQLPIPSITLNALFPHRLAAAANTRGARVLHFSTDCVFSGRKGGYTEADLSDAEEHNGKTKLLGEVVTPNALTLRTSIIGRELTGHRFSARLVSVPEPSPDKGLHAAHLLRRDDPSSRRAGRDLAEHHPTLSGLYQVTSPAITKYALLCLLREAFHLDIEVAPDSDEACDRSMVGARFDLAVSRVQPRWQDLVTQLASDPTPYNRWTQ